MASSPARSKKNREAPSSRPPSYYEDLSSFVPSLPSNKPYLVNQQPTQSSAHTSQPNNNNNNNVQQWADPSKVPSNVSRASWAVPASVKDSPSAQSRTTASESIQENLPPPYHLTQQLSSSGASLNNPHPINAGTEINPSESLSRRALDFNDDGPPPYEAVVDADPNQYVTPQPRQYPPLRPQQLNNQLLAKNGGPASATQNSAAAFGGNRVMISHFPSTANDIVGRRAARYRSNSSLELDRIVGVEGSGEGEEGCERPVLQHPVVGTISRSSRREYGSTSSIDVMGSNNEFFEMVKNYATDQSLDQRSPAPAAIRDILQGSGGVRASGGAISRTSGPIHDVQVDFDLDDEADGSRGGETNVTSDSGEIIPSGATMSDTEGTSVNQSPRIKSKATKIKERKSNRSKSVIQDQSTATASFFGKLRGGGGGSGGINSRQATVDPDIIKSTELYSSGFPPEVIFPPEILRGTPGGAPLSLSGVVLGSADQGGANSANAAAGAAAADGGGSTRRTVMHHDLQSVMFSFHDVIASKRLAASQRRNTTTGASAASAVGTGGRVHGGSAKEGPSANAANQNDTEYDAGDDKNNVLVKSCPFFRNELGGENFSGVFNVSLIESPLSGSMGQNGENDSDRIAVGAGVNAKDGPALGADSLIEHSDRGALYYRNFFQGQDHQNYFGNDENFGPVAISIKRERMEINNPNNESTSSSNSAPVFNFIYQYRVIVRTSELRTLRGAILEDDVPSASRHGGARGLPHKDVLEAVSPELQISALKVGQPGDKVQEQLIKLDEQGISSTYKVGIMYCKPGQSSEEEMYNNELAGPNFDKFLNLLGEKVYLKGFEKYRAQLDNKSDSTGTHSLYSCFDGCEIMFHVSTLLPYTQNNRQQLLRKRHIGNDIVTIVFQESGALPFTPKAVRSQFQHVFIVIQVLADSKKYGVAVSRSKDVPPFGPPIPFDGTFEHSSAFRDFLLAKVINAENAAHKSEKFRAMATRTRQEYLKDLATNYITSATLESSSKFAKFSMKKKDRPKSHILPCESQLSPAVVWSVCVEDLFGSYKRTPCYLAISSSALALVDKITGEVISFIINTNMIGWTESEESLRLYYDRGTSLLLQLHLVQDKRDIVQRLCQVSPACLAKDISLKRNGLGQLGFHVYSQGLVMDVEPYGPAWHSGLRPGSRLLEICKAMVIELTHEEMVELLRTSVIVTVLAVEPLEDGRSRGIVDNSDASDDSILSPSSTSNVTLDDASLASTFNQVHPVPSSTLSSQSSKHSNSSDRLAPSRIRSNNQSFDDTNYASPAHYQNAGGGGGGAGFYIPTQQSSIHSRAEALPNAVPNYEGYPVVNQENQAANQGTMNSNHSSTSASSTGSGLARRDLAGRNSMEGRHSANSGIDEQSGHPQALNGSDANAPTGGIQQMAAFPGLYHSNQVRREHRNSNLGSNPGIGSSLPKANALAQEDALRTSSRSSHASSNPISSQAGSKQGSYEYLSMWSGESPSAMAVTSKTCNESIPAGQGKEPQPQSQSHYHKTQSKSQPQHPFQQPSPASRASIQTPQVQSSSLLHHHNTQLIAPSSLSAFSPVAPRIPGTTATSTTHPLTVSTASPKIHHQEQYQSSSSDPHLAPKSGVELERCNKPSPMTNNASPLHSSTQSPNSEAQAFSRRSKLYSSERIFDPNRRAGSGSSAFTRSRPPLPVTVAAPSGNHNPIQSVGASHRKDKKDTAEGDTSVIQSSSNPTGQRSSRQRTEGGRLLAGGARPNAVQRLSPRGKNDSATSTTPTGPLATTTTTTTPPASCSFQEELMRLINPDIPESELAGSAVKSGGSTPKRYRPPLHRTLSDESLSSGGATLFPRSTNAPKTSTNQGISPRHSTHNILNYSSSSSDAVFTAKPAQIVSPRNLKDDGPSLITSSSDQLYVNASKASSAPHSFTQAPAALPSSSQNTTTSTSSKSISSSLGAAGPPGRQTTTASSVVSTNPASSVSFPLPDAAAGNIEWNNLVDAANRVMRESDLDISAPLTASLERLNSMGAAAAAAGPTKPARNPAVVNDNGVFSSPAVGQSNDASESGAESFPATELAKQLQELQHQLQRERLGRANLEEEVNYLRVDNERLAEESESAAAQLRKFTEWFFTTIDKS